MDEKKNYLPLCESNFFLQMGILWEGDITWSELLLNIRSSSTASSGLEEKQNDVLKSWEHDTLYIANISKMWY